MRGAELKRVLGEVRQPPCAERICVNCAPEYALQLLDECLYLPLGRIGALWVHDDPGRVNFQAVGRLS